MFDAFRQVRAKSPPLMPRVTHAVVRSQFFFYLMLFISFSSFDIAFPSA